MPDQSLPDILRKWTEVFMHRSMNEFRAFTRNSGLSMSQFHTLFRIYHRGMCGISDIGEHLGVSNAAASQMTDRLVQQGLIQRSEDPNDRRSKNLVLTAAGQALIQGSIEARLRWLGKLTTALTPKQQEEISAALTLLTQAAINLEENPLTRQTLE